MKKLNRNLPAVIIELILVVVDVGAKTLKASLVGFFARLIGLPRIKGRSARGVPKNTAELFAIH